MSWDKEVLISEEIKPVAIAIIELHLSEGIIKKVSWSKILLNYNFQTILVEGFMFDLKTFLRLAMAILPIDVTK